MDEIRNYASRPMVAPSGSILTADARILTPGGFKPLSKEEQTEARRIAEEAGFSFDGYQVVRKEFFSHRYDPTLTIKGKSITFNNACITKLEQVVYVQVLVNPQLAKLVIRPCTEGSKDAIRWCVPKGEKRKSREISCGLFTAKLYNLMGWQEVYRYKLQGTQISHNGEQLYVFDLKETEVYIPQSKDPEKPHKARTVFPADWRDSFGIPVVEHEEAAKINLMDGYNFADVSNTVYEAEYKDVSDEKAESVQLGMEVLQ